MKKDIVAGIAIFICGIAALLALMHYVPGDQNVGAYNPTAGGTYFLKFNIGPSDTSITLTSFLEPVSGIPYTMTYLNSTIEFGTINPQTGSPEFISFTGVTQNSDGTATLTGIQRGLEGSYPYAASTSLARGFPANTRFILSDSPQLFQQFSGGNPDTFWFNSGNILYNQVGTFVGINNANPLFGFDVIGSINSDGKAGYYYLGGKGFAYASTTNGDTFVGLNTGGSATTSTTALDNSAFGSNSLSANTTASNNNAFGWKSLEFDTTGSGNVAMGSQTLRNTTTGTLNTAIGYEALLFAVNTTNNTAVGSQALFAATGNFNTAIGSNSLVSDLGGVDNTAVGYNSLVNVGTGRDNTGIGFNSGSTLSGGNDNISIGAYVDIPNLNGNNQLNIGNVVFGTNIYGSNGAPVSSTPSANGSIGISTSTPWAKLAISLNSGDTLANAFLISSSTANSTSTLFLISKNGTAYVGTTTSIENNGALNVGNNTGGTSASSTIVLSGKLQIQGINTAGSAVCLFVVGTTPTVGSGACNP